MKKFEEPINGWVGIEYLGESVWKCKCIHCGKIKNIKGTKLRAGLVKECTCVKYGEYLNKEYYNCKVIEIINNKGRLLCNCLKCNSYFETTVGQLEDGTVKMCYECEKKQFNGHKPAFNFVDMTDKVYGELTGREYLGNGMWTFECSCGKKIKARGAAVRIGNTRSCGHTRGQKRIIDLKDKEFGSIKVIKHVEGSYWKCKCHCGNEVIVHSWRLRTGTCKSCGSTVHRYIDIKGKKFGELTAKEYLGNGLWKCECSCGNVKNILGCNLRNLSTQSCGCKTNELRIETLVNRYSDICPSRARNPREIWQMNTLYNPEELAEYALECEIIQGRKPFIKDMAYELNISTATLRDYITNYGIRDLFGNIDSGSSLLEQEIFDYIASIIPIEVTAIRRYKLDCGVEFDVYLPEIKLAIEVNGDYWHSNKFKSKEYHRNKTYVALKNGIRLIHIFEHEWNNEYKQIKIKGLLNRIINGCKNKIYAKYTVIRVISSDSTKDFIEDNHISGFTNAKISLGCYYNNELVGVMTFGKPRARGNEVYEYEVIRLCFKDDTAVIGGSEKLLKYFIDKYNPKNILSYCDISKFTGEVYERLKFSCIKITEPSYVWVNYNRCETLSRYQTTHSALVKKLGDEVAGMTEDEIMREMNYNKVYDCGNAKYVWGI